MFKTFRTSRKVAILCLGFAFLLSSSSVRGQRRQPEGPQQSAGKDSDLLKPLQWRSIGPYRGGRVTAVAGVLSQPAVFYFGATGGGVYDRVRRIRRVKAGWAVAPAWFLEPQPSGPRASEQPRAHGQQFLHHALLEDAGRSVP